MRKTSLLYLSLVVMIYGSISVNSSENNKQINTINDSNIPINSTVVNNNTIDNDKININPINDNNTPVNSTVVNNNTIDNDKINTNSINDNNTPVNNTLVNNFKYKFYDQKNNSYNFTDKEYNYLYELVVMICGLINVNSSENNKQININPINDNNTPVNNTLVNNFKYKFYDQKNNKKNKTNGKSNYSCEVVSEQIKKNKTDGKSNYSCEVVIKFINKNITNEEYNHLCKVIERIRNNNRIKRIIIDDVNSWCHIVYEFGEELLPFLKNGSNIRPVLDFLHDKKSDVVCEMINNINNLYQLHDIILYPMYFKRLFNHKLIGNSDINNNIVEKIKKIKLDDAYNNYKKLLRGYINDTIHLIDDLKYFLGIITNKTISNTLSPYRACYLDNTKLSSKCKNIFIANISTVEEYIKAKQGFINWDLYEYIDMLGEYSKKFSKYLHSNE